MGVCVCGQCGGGGMNVWMGVCVGGGGGLSVWVWVTGCL